MRLITVTLLIALSLGCGIKSKPLPPLKEPPISTGSILEDQAKKNKLKKPTDGKDNTILKKDEEK